MKGYLLVGLIGVMGLLVLSGCSNEYEVPAEPVWNECASWKLCDIPDRDVVNINDSGCIILDRDDAIGVWRWIRKYDTTMSAECVRPADPGQLYIREVPMGGN